MAELTQLNASVRVAGDLVHHNVNVSMDDSDRRVVARGMVGGRYDDIEVWEDVEFLWRKATGGASYRLADGRVMEIAKSKTNCCGG
jgi:hypothetical protein